jgi:hypothetical protein
MPSMASKLLGRHIGQGFDRCHAGSTSFSTKPSPRPGTLSSGVELRDHRRHLLLDFLALLLLALDVDLPAQQLGGQANVLPLLADGQRELAVIDDDFQMLSWLSTWRRALTLAGCSAFSAKPTASS